MTWARFGFWFWAFWLVFDLALLASGDATVNKFSLSYPRVFELVWDVFWVAVLFHGAPMWLRTRVWMWAVRKAAQR